MRKSAPWALVFPKVIWMDPSPYKLFFLYFLWDFSIWFTALWPNGGLHTSHECYPLYLSCSWWFPAPVGTLGFLLWFTQRPRSHGPKTSYRTGILRPSPLLLKACPRSVNWNLIFGLTGLPRWDFKGLWILLASHMKTEQPGLGKGMGRRFIRCLSWQETPSTTRAAKYHPTFLSHRWKCGRCFWNNILGCFYLLAYKVTFHRV